MKIINSSVREDIKRNRPLRLDLGCAGMAREGFYGLALLEAPGVDIVADLNEPLEEFPDNCVIEIYSSHTFEHIKNFTGLVQELYRVMIQA